MIKLFRFSILYFYLVIINLNNVYAQNIYFGDLHLHSDLSFDSSFDIDSLYIKARRDIKLDFIAISEHDYISTEERWQKSKKLVNRYYELNKFVTLSAYEYTQFDDSGHKIVIYPNTSSKRFMMEKFNEAQLFDSVYKYKGIIQIAHPDHGRFPSNLNLYDSRVVRTIEIIGSGSQYYFEYFGNPNAHPDQKEGSSVQDWIIKERLLGFTGVSDEHKGNLENKFRTAVIAESLTRESIFSAINKRHTYAVTGDKRIQIEFKQGDYIMGDSIPYNLGSDKLIQFSCIGTDTIRTVELIKNGLVINTYHGNSTHLEFNYYDQDDLNYSYYYVRVEQNDGNKAWTSPLYFFGLNETFISKDIIKIKNKGDILKVNNSPNPFELQTTIHYEILESGIITLRIYDILGRIIQIQEIGFKNEGVHEYYLNISNKLNKGILMLNVSLENEFIYRNKNIKMIKL